MWIRLALLSLLVGSGAWTVGRLLRLDGSSFFVLQQLPTFCATLLLISVGAWFFWERQGVALSAAQRDVGFAAVAIAALVLLSSWQLVRLARAGMTFTPWGILAVLLATVAGGWTYALWRLLRSMKEANDGSAQTSSAQTSSGPATPP